MLKQQTFGFRTERGGRTRVDKQREHDERNWNAARLILTNPDQYGGEEALAVRWARRVVARLGSEVRLHTEAAA